MAITEIYVDPAIAGDSGDGSIETPYGDLEYAIEQETFDLTNGTRVNIKAGTDEILAAKLETAMADVGTSIAWVPEPFSPLVFQGYTAAAGDGGIGGISGGGAVGIMVDATHDSVSFIDLHLHNCGAAVILDLDNFCDVIRCECNNTSGNGVFGDTNFYISECYLHDIGGQGHSSVTGTVTNCFFKNGTKTFTTAITVSGETFITNNIVSVGGTSDGIQSGSSTIVKNNSIYSAGGTGQGIVSAATKLPAAVKNNIVEGFSGGGGIGYDLDAASVMVRNYGGNASYDNETHFAVPLVIDNLGDNETLTASAFTDAANDDFSPVDTGNVKEGSLPQIIGGGLV